MNIWFYNFLARLEWESAVLRGASTFQSLEEERLNNLKSVLTTYLHHSSELNPRLIEVGFSATLSAFPPTSSVPQAVERLKAPAALAEPTRDLSTFINLRQSSQQVSEQLLPDFYCEHITLAMNRERRKQVRSVFSWMKFVTNVRLSGADQIVTADKAGHRARTEVEEWTGESVESY